MNDLRWTELAAHVVAWHNRHPLARHIGMQHVLSLGYVMLPFVDADAAPATRPAAGGARPAVDEPLPPEAMTGSLRERAMARAQLQSHDAAAETAKTPPHPAAASRLRPAFSEDFIAPLTPKAVRRWAAKHAVAQSTPRGDVSVRKVRAEPGVEEAEVLPRWVLTAQVEIGRARTRVLVGPGARPAVLGRHMISPGRTIALFALAGVLAGVAGWVVDREPAAVAVASRSASASASASPAASAPAGQAALPMASAPAPDMEPMTAHRTATGDLVVSHQVAPAPVASATSATSAATATPAVSATSVHSAAPASVAPAKETTPAMPAAERPVDVEPRLGKIDLPSLGPRVDERRRRAQEAAAAAAAATSSQAVASAAAPVPVSPAAPVAAQAPVPPRIAMAPALPGPNFAVTTRLLRTRSESEQVAAAMRELLAHPSGPRVRVEVLAVGDDWRVVGWPYLDRAGADKARALLASRGMKVQVIDF